METFSRHIVLYYGKNLHLSTLFASTVTLWGYIEYRSLNKNVRLRMKKEVWILILLLSLISFCSSSFAEENKQEAGREGPFDTTSKELKKKYQSVNGAIFATMISLDEFPGPTAGPGFYVGMNGPLVSIGWLEKNGNDTFEAKAKRYIPVGSILFADQPLHFEKGPDRYIVYYKGPFDETEFFILVDIKRENEEKSAYERFISRWKLYLLSQEPNR